MSTTKRILEVLEVIYDDEGRSAAEIAHVVGELPILVEEWLQHLRIDGQVIERLPPDGGSTSRWYCSVLGYKTVDWLRAADEITEEM